MGDFEGDILFPSSFQYQGLLPGEQLDNDPVSVYWGHYFDVDFWTVRIEDECGKSLLEGN